MRIAYLIHWNDGPESGVYKKIAAQIREWKRLGNEICLFLFTHNREWEQFTAEQGISITVCRYDNWRSRFTEFRELVRLIDRWQPDMIYHRFDLFYPSLDWILSKYPSVLEINTNDLTEMKLQQGTLRYWYHRLTRGRVLKRSRGNVYVSKELSEEEHYRKYAKSEVVIGNGIQLDQFPSLASPVKDGIRCVFIGSPGQAWHGVDKIMQLAELRPEWTFDLVGIHAKDIKGLNGKIPPNIVFHGRLNKEQYEPIMRKANIAIGSLAMHRAALKEGSPLKVREYLAYGIPVILGYMDTDFPEGSPYLLNLDNEENNIVPAIDRISDFVREWGERRVEREAISHLDSKYKEAKRISYMRLLAGNGEG